MKVLWLSNVMFPDTCRDLNLPIPVGGGWMIAGAMALINANPNISLAVASLYSGKELRCIDKYQIRYYLIPKGNKKEIYNPQVEDHFLKIKNDFQPDIVHIHGSEFPHSLGYIKACGIENVIVSIQGLVSIYSLHYLGGISIKEIKETITLRDMIRKDSLLQQQNRMMNRGIYEQELLQKVKYVIGRTSWDQANVWKINHQAVYFSCNETLRSSFYSKTWQYETCHKHTIFLSQAHYPIKGLQQIVKALPFILRLYPDTKIYVAGTDFFSKKPSWRKNGFANYIEKIMKKYDVRDRFFFLGTLTEEQMAEQYTQAHVFVCPSSIENSPNSIGEAQLIGTPCIASYVGGTMDMIEHEKTGLLYRFEEVSLLAYHICELFKNQELCLSLSNEERKIALTRHHQENNAQKLTEIYKSILEK